MTISDRAGSEALASVGGFSVRIHEAEEGETGFWGEALELPGCVSQGETREELLANMREAIQAVLPYSMPSAPVS